MLQASGSFFAYEPILKALQSNHSMPLAQYIAAPSLQCESGPFPPDSRAGGSLMSSTLSHGNKLFGLGTTPGMMWLIPHDNAAVQLKPSFLKAVHGVYATHAHLTHYCKAMCTVLSSLPDPVHALQYVLYTLHIIQQAVSK